jgi:predicted ATPase/class 3 adenylate cyclase
LVGLEPDVNASSPPSGTVTFLFTDVVGSTHLWDKFPELMADALEVHDRLIKRAIADHDGFVFSTAGDSYAAAFATSSSAVLAGLAAQQALADQVWPEAVVINVRMGAHTGEAQERDDDYFGPVVNRAARLMSAANGGQFVISAVTAALALAEHDVEYVDLGAVAVKGIVDPIQVVGVSSPRVPWIDRPLQSDQAVIGNLRRPQTEFVGDLADLQRRIAALGADRLVTLTGSGGVGKTRAATEIGFLTADDFPGGVWMCELAPIADPDAVIPAVIESIGAQPEAGMTGVEVIVDWCRDRRVLLILDNCEHLVTSVADLAQELAARCPTLTMLATSREPLGVPGERVVRLPSLDPAAGVQLFVDRASAVDSEFDLERDRDAIDAICERLDGIPLAIELAAARVRSLSPTEILDRLDECFRLLRGAGRGRLERHQTLHAAVEWSYRLLADASRNLFDELSIFAGSFDLDAVEGICSNDGDADLLDVLPDLVDKSMVVAEPSGRRTRYRLLETLRQYGEQRLADSDRTGGLRDRHLGFYATEATRAWRRAYTSNEAEFFSFFDAEWDNLRAALNWSLVRGDLHVSEQLLIATGTFAADEMRYEHEDWAVEVGELARRAGGRSAASLGMRAYWAHALGDPNRAVELGLEGATVEGDDVSASICLLWQSEALVASGRIDEARSLTEQFRTIIADTDSMMLRIKSWNMIFNILLGTGDPSYFDEVEGAREFYEETGSSAAASVYSFYKASGLLYLADPPDGHGAYEQYRRSAEAAERCGKIQQQRWSEFGMVNSRLLCGDLDVGPALHRVVTNSHDARLWLLTLSALEIVQVFHARRGALDEAATILGWVERRGTAWGAVTAPYRAEVASVLAGSPTATTARSNGARLDRHEIVAYALSTLEDA